MNTVSLVGRIATAPKLRKTTSGHDVCSFSVAVNRPGENKGADFTFVDVWGNSGVATATHKKVGDEVAISGSLRSSRYEKDGATVYDLRVNANNCTWLRNKGEGAAQADVALPAEPSEPVAAPTDDDIPF